MLLFHAFIPWLICGEMSLVFFLVGLMNVPEQLVLLAFRVKLAYCRTDGDCELL